MPKNWILIAYLIPYQRISVLVLGSAGLMLSGCQSLPSTTQPIEQPVTAETFLSPVASPLLSDNPILPSQDASVLWQPDDKTLLKQEEEYKPNGDLWHRIRGGYRLQAKATEPVQSVMRKYLKYPSYFNRLTENASPWLYHIVSEIEERGMPLEIALLPAVESNFEPLARSHRSAAGLWQFMPATGEYFGLEQNAWYDGRQDIVASTDAALEYLQKLHRMFDGDWFNALAAYNWGEGNVLKAIKKNAALGKPTDYWSLDLPTETRQFVPRLLALSTIIKNPKEYGVELEPIADSPYFEPVELSQQIDLEAAAKIIGLTAEDLKRLNPGYRGTATPPNTNSNHVLALPIAKADLFRRRMAALGPKSLAPTSVSTPAPLRLSAEKPTATSQAYYYQVRKGDTLGGIAQAHQTQLSVLKRLNQGLNPRQHLNIGQRLRVPRQAVETTPERLSAEKPTATSQAYYYQVRKGDTLGGIAQAHQTQISVLTRLNQGLNPRQHLNIGQRLRVPKQAVETTSERLSTEKPTATSQAYYYQVRKGDTLGGIAQAHQTQISVLTRLNQGLNPRQHLKIGQRLRVPKQASSQAEPVTAKKEEKKVVHTVRHGDSLWEIARRYKTSVTELRRWNRLRRGHTLQLGEKLLIWN